MKRGSVCLHLGLIYERQKHYRPKKHKNGNKVLSSNQISSSFTVGRWIPPPPSLPLLWVPLSLSIPPSLAFSLYSLHPLSERHAEAVGLLRRVWGSARAVRGCYLGLLQQTGSSSPKGRGRVESQSHAQISSAQPGRNQICIPTEGTRETPAFTGKDSRESDSEG